MWYVFDGCGVLRNWFLNENDASTYAAFVTGGYYCGDCSLSRAERDQVREMKTKHKGRMF